MDDDSQRYREILQESLLTAGWEAAFDHVRLRDWVRSNRDALGSRARFVLGTTGSSDEDHFARTVETFTPQGKYDLPSTEAIFGPLLDGVLVSARAIGLRPIRKVELVTSTSISPTPHARPTIGTHQLFIGQGTYSFCNYWAKAYTSIAVAIGANMPNRTRVSSHADLRTCLSKDPSGILLAARLALYYAATGTLMGFGEVTQAPSRLAYRLQLLSAMEVFALSHEYSHFVAHEKGLSFVDESGRESSTLLEFFCDSMGLQISRDWGSKNDNWLAFTGVGGLAYFRAVDTCTSCAAMLADTGSNQSNRDRSTATFEEDSHPPIADRVANLIGKAVQSTCGDQRPQVKSFLDEYDLICSAIRSDVMDILEKACTE